MSLNHPQLISVYRSLALFARPTFHAKRELFLAHGGGGAHFQIERLGYFFTDPRDSTPNRPVFNRTATLRDTWAKEAAKP